MNRFFAKKAIAAIIFISFIYIFSLCNFINSYKSLSMVNNDENIISNIENTINENILFKYGFVESYGYIQRLMGKNEENNFELVKDNNNIFHYTYFSDGPKDVNELVESVTLLKSNMVNKNTKIICIIPPDKFIRGYTSFPTGMPYSYDNETADNYIQGLRDKDVQYIDLRDSLLEKQIDLHNMFYKTDHHLKTETAFSAFQVIIYDLASNDDKLLQQDLDYFLNKQNYNFIEYKNSYVGSMARKAGITYTGVDDFTLIYPKFKTNYIVQYTSPNKSFESRGLFQDTMINSNSFLNKNGPYSVESDKYFSYLLGNISDVHIKNNNISNGSKAVFIKDSFAVPVAAFMSTLFEDIYLVDPRYYEGSIKDYVNSISNIDYLFIFYSLPNLTTEFFDFS